MPATLSSDCSVSVDAPVMVYPSAASNRRTPTVTGASSVTVRPGAASLKTAQRSAALGTTPDQFPSADQAPPAAPVQRCGSSTALIQSAYELMRTASR